MEVIHYVHVLVCILHFSMTVLNIYCTFTFTQQTILLASLKNRPLLFPKSQAVEYFKSIHHLFILCVFAMTSSSEKNNERLAIRHMNKPIFPTTLSNASYDIWKKIGLRTYQHPTYNATQITYLDTLITFLYTTIAIPYSKAPFSPRLIQLATAGD